MLPGGRRSFLTAMLVFTLAAWGAAAEKLSSDAIPADHMEQ